MANQQPERRRVNDSKRVEELADVVEFGGERLAAKLKGIPDTKEKEKIWRWRRLVSWLKVDTSQNCKCPIDSVYEDLTDSLVVDSVAEFCFW